jgi:hypothetical protein
LPTTRLPRLGNNGGGCHLCDWHGLGCINGLRFHPNKRPLFQGTCMWNLPVPAWREKLCLGRSPKFSQGSIPTKCSSSRDDTWNLRVLDWSRKLCLGGPPNYILHFSAKVVRFRSITFPSSFALGKGDV